MAVQQTSGIKKTAPPTCIYSDGGVHNSCHKMNKSGPTDSHLQWGWGWLLCATVKWIQVAPPTHIYSDGGACSCSAVVLCVTWSVCVACDN